MAMDKRSQKILSLIVVLLLVTILGLMLLHFVLRKDTTVKKDHPQQGTSSSEAVSFFVQNDQIGVARLDSFFWQSMSLISQI